MLVLKSETKHIHSWSFKFKKNIKPCHSKVIPIIDYETKRGMGAKLLVRKRKATFQSLSEIQTEDPNMLVLKQIESQQSKGHLNLWKLEENS